MGARIQFYFTESNDTSRMKIYEQISRIPFSSHRVSRQLELEHFLRPLPEALYFHYATSHARLGQVEKENIISQARFF